MTPAQFRAWRKRLGFSQVEAAAALGLGKHARMISYYEKSAKEDGKPIPRYIALACAAIALGLREYGE